MRFIRAAQAAGLSLVQIRGVVESREHGQAPCTHVAQVIEAKLAEVQQRLLELVRLQDELQHLRERGRSLDPADCSDAAVCHILAGDG